jgi:hypothetical protein
VNVLAVDFTPERVDASQGLYRRAGCRRGSAEQVLNGLEVAIEVNPDFVSHWDAILHIEKEFLHCLTSDTNPARQESNTLSVTDRCLGRGADGTIMRFGVTETLVNIAHF